MKRRIRVALIGAGGIFKAHRAVPQGGRPLRGCGGCRGHPERADEVQALLGNVRIGAIPQRAGGRGRGGHLLPRPPPGSNAGGAGREPVLIEKVMAQREDGPHDRGMPQGDVNLTVCHDARASPDWMALKRVLNSRRSASPSLAAGALGPGPAAGALVLAPSAWAAARSAA